MNKGDPQEHKFAKLKEKRNSENSSAPKTKPEWEETQREEGERERRGQWWHGTEAWEFLRTEFFKINVK